MEEPREIQGVEFDWFAIDQDGHCALFATAGQGPVPAGVMAETAAHDAVGERIQISGFGSPVVWQSYAYAGLYAFDWSDAQRTYVRVAESASNPPPELTSAIRKIPNVPHLPLSFSCVAVIAPEWQDGI